LFLYQTSIIPKRTAFNSLIKILDICVQLFKFVIQQPQPFNTSGLSLNQYLVDYQIADGIIIVEKLSDVMVNILFEFIPLNLRQSLQLGFIKGVIIAAIGVVGAIRGLHVFDFLGGELAGFRKLGGLFEGVTGPVKKVIVDVRALVVG
jgi:hypothetical protein